MTITLLPGLAAPVVLDALAPFHQVVATAQRALRTEGGIVWVRGPNAAPVAARLARLVRGQVGVELVPGDDLATAARDLVALAGISGGRTPVLVTDPATRLGLIVVLRQELARGRQPYPAHFGGDAFTATIRLPWPVEVAVHGAADGVVAVRPASAALAPRS